MKTNSILTKKMLQDLIGMFFFWLPVVLGDYLYDNGTVVLIQGYPCGALYYDIIVDEERTSWPLECDHLCSQTAGCESFTWSRRDGVCRLYKEPTPPPEDCYVQSDHHFWFIKHFALSRHLFTPFDNYYVTLTKGNRYGLGASDEPLVGACIKGGQMSWHDARGFCDKDGYEMFAPRDLYEVEAMKMCLGIDDDFWTGFKYNGIEYVDAILLAFLGFPSESLMIFDSDPMWNIEGNSPTAAEFANKQCIYYENNMNSLYYDVCDGGSYEAVCVSKINLETCENTKVAPSRSATVVINKQSVPFILFFSTSECDYHNSQMAVMSYLTNVYNERWDTIRTAAKAANPDGDYGPGDTIYFRFKLDTSAYACSPVRDPLGGISPMECSDPSVEEYLNLCQADLFASDQMVKYRDADKYCTQHGARLPYLSELTSGSALLETMTEMSCDWSLFRVYQSGEPNLVVQMTDDSAGYMQYTLADSLGNTYNADMYGTVLCKFDCSSCS